MLRTSALQELAFLYNNLNSLRKYALRRPSANVSFETERKILGYTDAQQFRSVVLDHVFGTLKNRLMAYRTSLLSVKSP